MKLNTEKMFESACAIVIISYSSRAFGIIPHATWSIFLLITGLNWGARFIREETLSKIDAENE